MCRKEASPQKLRLANQIADLTIKATNQESLNNIHSRDLLYRLELLQKALDNILSSETNINKAYCEESK